MASQAVMSVRDGGRACYVGIASATTKAEVPTLGRGDGGWNGGWSWISG